MELIISQNLLYVSRFFHPLVYGLYFKQVREPMMEVHEEICKDEQSQLSCSTTAKDGIDVTEHHMYNNNVQVCKYTYVFILLITFLSIQ